MLKQSRSLRLSINIYVLNAIYTYYTVAHRSECDDWRLLLLLRTWNCAFAIAVRCMVVVLKTSLEIHINCLFPLLDLLQSSKAIKGTRTVIGHAQVFLFSSPLQTRLQHFCRSQILTSTKRKCHTGCWSCWKCTASRRLCVADSETALPSMWRLSTPDEIKSLMQVSKQQTAGGEVQSQQKIRWRTKISLGRWQKEKNEF